MSSAVFDSELYRLTRTTGGDDATAARQLYDRGMFGEHDWHTPLTEHLNHPIERILHSANPLIRAIGMLDKRVGNRRLRSLVVSREYILVKRFYALRWEAENIPGTPEQSGARG